MELSEFVSTIEKNIAIGTEFENPGGGTSVVKTITPLNISYMRGNSRITVGLQALFQTYVHFSGKSVSCSELKKYAPNIFDSNARPAGHTCNCTFLFLLLMAVDLVDEIDGAGTRGNPFRAFIKVV